MNVTSFNIRVFVLPIIFSLSVSCIAQSPLEIPELKQEPIIDGNLDEWKDDAFYDGVWDLDRVRQSPWYEPKRNRLVRHADEDSASIDLSAQYYLAWKGDWLYFGAVVLDNVNDVMDTLHEAKRWYYKDAIALFIEAPRDTLPEKFEEGDHAFCFVIDDAMPTYGAWWRHGTSEEAYIEEPLPFAARSYVIQMDTTSPVSANYILEARIDLSATLGIDVRSENEGDNARKLSLMIVHCDPDGGEYGGHLLIYGKGDNDATWRPMHLVPQTDD